VRFVLLALGAVVFGMACTQTEANVATTPAEPERTSTGGTTTGSASEENATLAEGEEQPLVGQPQSASPMCGTGLTCSGTEVGGSTPCRQNPRSTGDVFCCPHVGDRIVNGACVAKLCGSGLLCSSSPTVGADACRQTTSSKLDIFCCPIEGWRIENGECIPPLCGTGLTCAASATTGATACRQYTTSTNDVFCCPTTGAKIVSGRCQ
jgi:hypothetical protein